MDSFEINKILGAVLGTLTVVLGLNILAGELFKPPKLKTPGYVVEVASAQPAAPAGGGQQQAALGPKEPIGQIMANASAQRGQEAARACASCHSFEKGGANRVGPNLWGVVTGSFAHVQGFGYSQALRARAQAGAKWGYEELYAFLENPRQYLPGTSMSYAGVRSSGQRADLIAYLRSLADQPAPLPNP